MSSSSARNGELRSLAGVCHCGRQRASDRRRLHLTLNAHLSGFELLALTDPSNARPFALARLAVSRAVSACGRCPSAPQSSRFASLIWNHTNVVASERVEVLVCRKASLPEVAIDFGHAVCRWPAVAPDHRCRSGAVNKLASTASPSGLTRPSEMQRCTMLSNSRRNASLSQKRPCLFFESVG
jgi:hypothetical protein